MKRLLVAAALLVTASSAVAEWTLIHSNENYDLYYEPARVRIEGNFVKYWTLESHKQSMKFEGQPYRSLIYLIQIDCRKEIYRTLSGSLYSDEMSRGSVVKTSDQINEWKNLTPGSIADQFAQQFCPKK